MTLDQLTASTTQGSLHLKWMIVEGLTLPEASEEV